MKTWSKPYYTLTDWYEGNSKFFVPKNTNYFPKRTFLLNFLKMLKRFQRRKCKQLTNDTENSDGISSSRPVWQHELIEILFFIKLSIKVISYLSFVATVSQTV